MTADTTQEETAAADQEEEFSTWIAAAGWVLDAAGHHHYCDKCGCLLLVMHDPTGTYLDRYISASGEGGREDCPCHLTPGLIPLHAGLVTWFARSFWGCTTPSGQDDAPCCICGKEPLAYVNRGLLRKGEYVASQWRCGKHLGIPENILASLMSEQDGKYYRSEEPDSYRSAKELAGVYIALEN